MQISRKVFLSESEIIHESKMFREIGDKKILRSNFEAFFELIHAFLTDWCI